MKGEGESYKIYGFLSRGGIVWYLCTDELFSEQMVKCCCSAVLAAGGAGTGRDQVISGIFSTILIWVCNHPSSLLMQGTVQASTRRASSLHHGTGGTRTCKCTSTWPRCRQGRDLLGKPRGAREALHEIRPQRSRGS